MPVVQVSQKRVFDLADRRKDRNFRYAGQERLSRKAVRTIPVERTDSEEQFLQVFKRGGRPRFSLSTYQGVLPR